MPTVYLLHLEPAFKHAKHYVGWTGHADLATRLDQHRAGRGARLLAVQRSAGGDWVVARTWEFEEGQWRDARALEKRIKKNGGATRLCPVCCPDNRRMQ